MSVVDVVADVQTTFVGFAVFVPVQPKPVSGTDVTEILDKAYVPSAFIR